MIERILILGLIGTVLINGVASVIDDRNGGFVVISRPKNDTPNDMGAKDFVDENLDDVDPRPKPKIVDPLSEYDPSLNADYFNSSDVTDNHPIIGNRVGVDSEEQSVEVEKPKPTEKAPINKETQPGYMCQFALCKKIDEAMKTVRKDIDNNFESLMNAGRTMFETKVKFVQSLPTAVFTFFRTLMNRDQKS